MNLKEKTETLAKQVWRGHPGPEDMDGLTLAKRMVKFGIIKSLDELLSLEIGECFTTGVSAWERIS